MRKLISIIILFNSLTSNAQNKKLVDYFKIEAVKLNGGDNLCLIQNFRNNSKLALPTDVARKYFKSFLKLERIEPVEDMITLKDLGRDRIQSLIFPIARVTTKDFTFLFAMIDSQDMDYFGICAVYENKQKKITNIIKVLSDEENSGFLKNFRLCNKVIIITTFKPYEILDKNVKTKNRYNFKIKFINNYIQLNNMFTLVKTDSLFSEILNGNYTINVSKTEKDDPTIQECK